MHSTGRLIKRLKFQDNLTWSEIQGDLWRRDLHRVFPDLLFRIHPEKQKSLRTRRPFNICQYCGNSTTPTHLDPDTESLTEPITVAWVCRNCGYWHVNHSSMIDDYEVVPYVSDFDPSLHTPALSSLAKDIAANQQSVSEMEPRTFEILVGSILTEFFNCDVKHVGRSHDGGVDLIVVAADEPILVQVKRRSRPHAVEGLEVVKNMFASLFSQRAQHGMVVTSAERFTAGAMAWARHPALSENQFTIDLLDMDSLLSMIRAYNTGETPGWESWRETSFGNRRSGGEACGSARMTSGENGVVVSINRGGKEWEDFWFSAYFTDRCWKITLTDDLGATVTGSEGAELPREGYATYVDKAYGELLGVLPTNVTSALSKMWVEAGEAESFGL